MLRVFVVSQNHILAPFKMFYGTRNCKEAFNHHMVLIEWTLFSVVMILDSTVSEIFPQEQTEMAPR